MTPISMVWMSSRFCPRSSLSLIHISTCDADFFEELDIVVLGNGDAAIEEAGYLSKFANSVTIIVIHDEGILDAAPMLQERAFNNPKIKWVWNSTLAEIKGDGLVESCLLYTSRCV